MQILMLGWEFPPFITGGLGTACHGLTKAMDERGMQVTFVLPQAVDSSQGEHVRLLSPQSAASMASKVKPTPASDNASDSSLRSTVDQSSPLRHTEKRSASTQSQQSGFVHTQFLSVPAGFTNPYTGSEAVGEEGTTTRRVPGAASDKSTRGGASTEHVSYYDNDTARQTVAALEAAGVPSETAHHAALSPDEALHVGAGEYGGDMFAQIARYAAFCTAAVRRLNLHFDVIHAHDWMTYPAGLALARITGAPLVVHVHSTEFDRSGEHVNQRIYDIERRGMHGAMRVITVSQLTKNIASHRYAVNPDKIEVVYNGVDIEPTAAGITGIRRRDRIVLYFGRITYQKGPEYFLRAARRVVDYLKEHGDPNGENVKFVVAGSGDMVPRMIELAAELGIGERVLFTGFLRGKDIARVFSMADLYVMPSVSEPFGIAPLEAMGHDVPTIISRSSGVSEVLTHTLKVDFWDVDDMANKIIAVLKYSSLSGTLREHGRMEVRRLTWAGAAERCEKIYHDVVEGMTPHRPRAYHGA